ncbi:epithelial membrane protein 3 isoform X2 [Callithrix jacchus]
MPQKSGLLSQTPLQLQAPSGFHCSHVAPLAGGLGPSHPHSHPAFRGHLGQGWLKAVQVLMVLSLILCCLSFILFMFQLYTMRRGGLFYATGLCQLCTSVAVFTGALIYAIHAEEILVKHPPGGSFGYCFALAWVAFPLALVSGIIYIHLRKRE